MSGDGTDPPWRLGWFESNEGGFQKLRRLSRHSNHRLLTWSLRDLREFDREVMSEVDRELMVSVCHGYVRVGWALGRTSKI